jgi:2-polyprenyl-3-methyl-5-hydroxy-6-metoxy-1,4-benzoquinol methylase
MKNTKVLEFSNLPFCIGATPNYNNPGNIPNTYPFKLIINDDIGRLEQANTADLDTLLDTSYSLGLQMGTPSDNTDLGLPYVNDFISFIEKHMREKGKILEIGAGTGFLSRVMIDRGWVVDSIEPGAGYSDYWKKYNIKVINDFFPSDMISDRYDLIVFYTVLEHLHDTTSFLKEVGHFLKENGKIALSVPDCTEEIEIGDPSILLHEHYHYFTSPSLIRSIAKAGFSGIVQNSTFARSLYVIASKNQKKIPGECVVDIDDDLLNYGLKVNSFKAKFQAKIEYFSSRGSVGIYCPARALNLISGNAKMRFFDDSPLLKGKYYPPFNFVIESREQLISNPTDYLFIASRTFGEKLKSELEYLLPNTIIETINILKTEY